jgi:hypothetical protein
MLNILRSLRLLILAATLCSFLFVGSANAQTKVTSAGREFWFGFMPNYIDPADRLNLYIATESENRVTIELYGLNGAITWTKVINLAGGEAFTVQVPPNIAETRSLETPVYQAVRVTSTSFCTVVGYSDNALTTDAFLAIPLPALGTEYYCVSYFDDAYAPGQDHLGGEFLIVAPYDGTQVTITTNANTTLSEDGKTIGHTKGQTWTVNLSKGQTYLVQSTGFGYGVEDLTGSKVTSNKPIGFLSGHQRAAIELGGEGTSKEHLIEMLPSTDHWGTEYVTIPLPSKPIAGSYYRVISAEAGNIVRVNDSTITLDAGAYAEFSQVTTPIHFISTSNKRFLAVQYAYAEGSFGDPSQGDATMIALTPVAHFVTNALFRAPSNNSGSGSAFRHYASVITTSKGLSDMLVKKGDAAPVPITAFGGLQEPIAGTSYSSASLRLTGEDVSWSISSSAPFTLIQYGYASKETYGYPGPRSFDVVQSTVASETEGIVELWPNPASNKLNIDLPEDLILVSVSAVDAIGVSYPIQVSRSGGHVSALVDRIPSGSYRMLIETSRGLVSHPLVIKR